MKPITAAVIGAVGTIVVIVSGTLGYVVATGLRASPQPSSLEEGMARRVRRLAVPRAEARRANPVPRSAAALDEGLAHYADHCASCHAIDGSGNTEMGRGLFPKAPDMRGGPTQALTDGELFYVIEHGIRFTGMPAWSTGTAEGETASWQLVHVIRHLPRLSVEERAKMEALMPRSPEDVRQEIEEEQFLSGGDVPPPSSREGGPSPHSH
jgi:mono/diheme cytochrome c family protein